METIFQGEIALDGSTKIVATSSAIIVTSIIINNISDNYSLILYRCSGSNPKNIIPIYRFDLDAGDTIRDSEEYILNIGDSLKLVTNIPNTTYYIKTTT